MNTMSKFCLTPATVYGILVVVSFFTFSRALSYPLLDGWDDYVYITKNIQRLSFSISNILNCFTSTTCSNYHPLTMLSFMVDYLFWNTNGFGYHLQSIIWHIIAVIGFFRCLCYFHINPWVRLGIAIVFAIHPQRVESVVWISERKDVLCGAFYFWGLNAYMRYREHTLRRSFPTSSFLFFLCAIMSKSMAISFPIILILYELHREGRLKIFETVSKLWPFLGISILFLPVTFLSQGNAIQSHINPIRQLGVVCHNLLWYPLKTVVPTNLNPLYPRISFDTITIFEIAVAYAVLSWIFFKLYKRSRSNFLFDVTPMVLCYPVCLGPVIGFIPLGSIDIADRYSYLPSAFLLLIVGVTITHLVMAPSKSLVVKQQNIRISTPPTTEGMRTPKPLFLKGWIWTTIFSTYAVGLSAYSVVYTAAWKDCYSLMSWAYQPYASNPVTIGTLAEIELTRKDYGRVLRLADELSSLRGSGLTPQNVKANTLKANYLRAATLFHLGRNHQALGLLEKIEPHLEVESLREVFNFINVYAMIGDVYRELGEYVKAKHYYTLMLAEDPQNYEAFINRGVCNFNSHEFEHALHDFQQALILRPNDRLAIFNLSQTQEKLGL